MNHFRILCLTTTLTCASCSVGPNFKLPEVLMPSKWKNGGNSSTADIPVPGEWWKLFGSAELNRLEARALENNQELRGALARVETARALVGTQQGDWFPQLSMKNGMQYERLSQSSFGANLPPASPCPACSVVGFKTCWNWAGSLTSGDVCAAMWRAPRPTSLPPWRLFPPGV